MAVGDIKGAFLSDTVTEKDNVNYALTAEFDGTNRLSSLAYSNGKLGGRWLTILEVIMDML